LLLWAKELVELIGGGFLEAGEDVRIDPERNFNPAVTEAFTDDLRMHSLEQQQGRRRVPKVVETDGRHSRILEQRVILSADKVALAEEIALGAREDKPSLHVPALGERRLPVFVERVQREPREGDSSSALLRLGRREPDGIDITTSGNFVEGNFIGTDSSGTVALGNTGDGVNINAPNNTIGGAASGAGNTIAFNSLAGVLVDGNAGNLISRNSIFSNGALGIDLNEANNVNNSQPAPVLTSAVLSGGTTTVQGTLTAAANTTFTIEFFANAAADPSGFGQGKFFLGSITVTTDNTGAPNFSTTLSGVLSGQFITATATDPGNDTSEFSNALAVTG
jgi:hypothetical protein